MSQPAQIPLDLRLARVQSGHADYFVSQSNGLAYQLVTDWTNWPQNKLIVAGAAGSGKSHLARVWTELTGGHLIAASQLVAADIPNLARGPVAVDDLGLLIGQREVETQLFHLHNLLQAEGHSLLMTSRQPPNRMEFTVADLQSRLGAAAVTTLEAPDDALLGAIVVKLFADRQIAISPNVLNYALPRLGRSFEAAASFVSQMDARALSESRPIGRALARDVLEARLDKPSENRS